MTVGQMMDRIVAFKVGDRGRFLRDIDPECADEIAKWWDTYGPHGSTPDVRVVHSFFTEVEKRIAIARNPNAGDTTTAVDALASAKSMGAVMSAFELCKTVDDVHEFFSAYAVQCKSVHVARSNLDCGIGYCDATDRIKELFAEWLKREFGGEA